MKKITLSIIPLCVFISMANSQNVKPSKVDKLDKTNAIGYWQIPQDKQKIEKDKIVIYPGNDLFFFDNSFVTLYLFSKHDWMWKTEDNFYKLKSKWENDSLYYLPPFGDWTFLAKFDGTNFITENKDENVIWKYDKIKKEEIDRNNISILKDRKVHNYDIKPTDK